jgi:integrase
VVIVESSLTQLIYSKREHEVETRTIKTTAEVAEAYLAMIRQDVAAGTRRPSTLREYSRLLPRLLALETTGGWTLGGITFTDVTKAQVGAVLRTFARTPIQPRLGKRQPDGTRAIAKSSIPAAQTVRNAKTALSSLFAEMDAELAFEREANPCHGHAMKRILGTRPKRQSRYLTAREQDDLIALTTPAYRAIVATILGTGLRSAEVRGLRWCDVDLEASVLRVEGQAGERGERSDTVKTHTSRREIVLWPETVAVLEAHREEARLLGRDIAGAALAFATDSGKASSGTNLHRAVRRAAKRAGVDESISVHDLRHSYAVVALQGDETKGRRPLPLNVISQQLGHANVEITARIYVSTKLSLDEKRRLVLGDWLVG